MSIIYYILYIHMNKQYTQIFNINNFFQLHKNQIPCLLKNVT